MEAGRYVIPRSDIEDMLVIGISVSGETARTIEALRLANARGARTLGLTTDATSTLAETADALFVLELPDYPLGPGLISYLAALLVGFAMAAQIAEPKLRDHIQGTLSTYSAALEGWWEDEAAVGRDLAARVDPTQPILFLGSGPARGAAMFAAAKVIEAVGQAAAAQDAEEWAHLEYFNDPAAQPIWLLSTDGRAQSREGEIEAAAREIGRTVLRSRLSMGPDELREDLSPLALWAGPVAYADTLMERIGEAPFRGFGGGRSIEEGGGESRIRSSHQIRSLKDLSKFNPLN